MRDRPTTHRAAEGGDRRQPAHELEVVPDRLAEADPRVEADPLFGDAFGHGERESLLEKRCDLGNDVLVVRIVLHGLRLAEHVHQTEPRAALRNRRCEARITSESRDVVDDDCPEPDRLPRDLRLRGVDRDGYALESLEHGHHAPKLLVERNGGRPGARRLAAHVDDGGALVPKASGVRDRLVGRRVAPAVGERVGRDVDDAQHAGPRQQDGNSGGVGHGRNRTRKRIAGLARRASDTAPSKGGIVLAQPVVIAFEDQSWGFLIWGIVSVLIGVLVWQQPSILPYLVSAYAIMIGAFSIITAFLL